MRSESIKAVVFDCDGVMFDTADSNRIYYNTVLEHFGKSHLDNEQFEKVHMYTVKGALEYLFPELESLAPVYEFMQNVGYHGFIRHMIMEPGLKPLLKRLKARGYIRAVATNRTNTMAAVLDQHRLVRDFEMVVTAADVDRAKPAPDQLFKIMDAFSLKPSEVLFIGDSSFDQEAAQSAGTMFVAFKNKDLPADYHGDSMMDIENILQLKA